MKKSTFAVALLLTTLTISGSAFAEQDSDCQSSQRNWANAPAGNCAGSPGDSSNGAGGQGASSSPVTHSVE